jgi:poly(A) polymerase
VTRASDPIKARDAACRVVRRLRDEGHVAYLAGGCVRDELLGLHPTDYDVATDAVPDRIRAIFPRTAEVGAVFGVILVRDGNVTIEVATFRSDGPYTDRRRPDSVRFSDPESDARRRDFTINALFLDPFAAGPGRVRDFVGGVADLDRRILRAVGDPHQRLAEDHLRALRAVRLAARLSLTIDPATGAAIRRHARELAGVSRERIGDELRRMMVHPTRAHAVRLLMEHGLDGPVLAEDSRPAASTSSSLAVLPADAAFPTCLAAWAMDRGTPLTPAAIDDLVTRWRAALCLSNDECDALQGTLRTLLAMQRDWSVLSAAGQKRLAACRWAGPALDVLQGPDSSLADAVRRRISELASTPGGLEPTPLLNGDALIQAGFRPGPAFKLILDRVYDAQLEGRVTTTQQALELARGVRV